MNIKEEIETMEKELLTLDWQSVKEILRKSVLKILLLAVISANLCALLVLGLTDTSMLGSTGIGCIIVSFNIMAVLVVLFFYLIFIWEEKK